MTALPQRIRAGCDCAAEGDEQACKRFATAHSCGLRLRLRLSLQAVRALPQRIRAGCDFCSKIERRESDLCHSAFVRVATAKYFANLSLHLLCHSAFVRVATLIFDSFIFYLTLCHSAFVRVATAVLVNVHACDNLCHSAFVRVATPLSAHRLKTDIFATAHSCGLRQNGLEKS